MSGFRETMGRGGGEMEHTIDGIAFPAVPREWLSQRDKARKLLGMIGSKEEEGALRWQLNVLEKQIRSWREYREDRARAFARGRQRAHAPQTSLLYAALDIETVDPFLHEYGAGAITGSGYILGVGIWCPQKHLEGYFDWQDERVRELLEDERAVCIFHNAIYDTDWLQNWAGYKIKARVEDTITRQALIDGYSLAFGLDYCCKQYGLEGKNKGETVASWWASHGDGSKVMSHLNKVPREIVGKYCVQDCKSTWDLFCAQQPLLEEEGLEAINDVECGLFPWLLATKKNGLRVDEKARLVLRDKLKGALGELEERFKEKYGKVNVNSNKQLQVLFAKLGYTIPTSPKTGKPSFGDYQLTNCGYEIGKEIQEIRGTYKLLNSFVDGAFVEYCYKGHIHTTLHPAKSDEGGCVTGRFSASDPNLQQVPAHFLGADIKKIFIPEDGCYLCAFDYKQIEYRLFAHFSVNPHGSEIRRIYNEAAARGEDVDYHAVVQKMLGWWDPERPQYQKDMRNMTKRVNFGSLYGLQAKSFAYKFGKAVLKSHPDFKGTAYELCKQILEEYYEKAKFVKPTMEAIEKVGERRGYVRTIGGRRQRNPPNGKLFTLVNYLMQGSAADIAKKAIVDSWKAGVWDVLVSHNMVHDEFVFSAPRTKEGYEACLAMVECMTNSYKLEVPLGVDTEIGLNWKDCDMETWENFKKEVAA